MARITQDLKSNNTIENASTDLPSRTEPSQSTINNSKEYDVTEVDTKGQTSAMISLKEDDLTDLADIVGTNQTKGLDTSGAFDNGGPSAFEGVPELVAQTPQGWGEWNPRQMAYPNSTILAEERNWAIKNIRISLDIHAIAMAAPDIVKDFGFVTDDNVPRSISPAHTINDAFRHAAFCALSVALTRDKLPGLTLEQAGDKVREIADIHEKGDRLQGGASTAMDKHNNELGIRVAIEVLKENPHASNREIILAVREALIQGEGRQLHNALLTGDQRQRFEHQQENMSETERNNLSGKGSKTPVPTHTTGLTTSSPPPFLKAPGRNMFYEQRYRMQGVHL